MEFIKNTAQFEKMIDNKIIGMPELINSKINFRGKNNILICDNNIKIENAILNFNGDNSIVYLGSNLTNGFKLVVYNNSTGFIGKYVKIGFSATLKIFESQNIIIGDDCFIGDNVYISNSDGFPIYNNDTKERINFSNSIYIGDHVFLGNNVYISKSCKVGSGSIIDHNSFIPSYAKIPSNCYLSGNPVKIIKSDVFFTKEFTSPFKNEDSLNSRYYKSDVFIFKVVEGETLSMADIDNVLNELDVESKHDFIHKLFIRNKRKNRFAI